MKIRREQIDALDSPDSSNPRRLAAAFQEMGATATHDGRTGAVILRQPGIGQTRINFNKEGTPRSIALPDGRTLTLECDSDAGRAAVVDAAGARTSYQFNESRQLTAVFGAGGSREYLQYDHGSLAHTQRSDGTSLRFAYDAESRLASIIDDAGRSLRFHYDADNRLSQFIDRRGAPTTFAIDDRYRPLTVDTATGGRWQFQYDDQRELTALVYPDGRRDTYEFSVGSLKREIRRDGRTFEFGYSPSGELTTVTPIGDEPARASFDDDGNLVLATGAGYSVQRSFDKTGRMVAEEVDGRRVEVRYSEDGFLSEMVTHRGERITFRYGRDQRVCGLVDWTGQLYGVERDGHGFVTSLQFPNGVTSTRRLSQFGLLESESVSGGETKLSRSYRWDFGYLLTDVEDSEQGAKRFSYDEEDQLVRAASATRAIDIEYDAHGSVMKVGDIRFSINAADQITAGTGIRCAYDQAGNLVSWTQRSCTTEYEFDVWNRLIRATLPDGRVATYEYDSLGRRVVKRVGEAVTTYTWWGQDLLAEDTYGPYPSRVDYLYLPGTWVPLARRVDGAKFYYLTDHLDAPVRLIDDQGAVVWHAESYGFDSVVLTNRVAQPLRQPGQYFDEETGLCYNGARYYQPLSGRFISADPLLFVDGMNLYRYAANNPVCLIDPTGRILPLIVGAVVFVAACTAIGAVAGAAFGAAHKLVSNYVQGEPLIKGVGDAALSGVKNGAVGGLGFGVGALIGGPVGAVVGAIAAPAALAAVEAPSGRKAEACVDALPIAGALTRYAHGNPGVKSPRKQLAVDLVFDAVGLALLGFGARGMRGRTGGWTEPYRPAIPAPPKYAGKEVPVTDYGKRWDARHPGRLVTYSESELAARRVTGKDGKLVYAQTGEPVNSTPNTIYVMDNKGNVYIDEGSPPEVHHSSMSGENGVVAAGQIEVVDGKVISVNENTGHYGENQPTGRSQVVKQELGSQGVDTSHTTAESYDK